jgi:hypothetical protein
MCYFSAVRQGRRRIFFPVAFIALLLGVLIFPPVYRLRTRERCEVCFASRETSQWRVGRWSLWSMPASTTTETIAEVRFAGDYLAKHEIHSWKFAQESPYYWGGQWGGCALGPGRGVSRTFESYEMFPEFRAFVQNEITTGALAATQFVAIVSDRSLQSTALRKQGDDLLEAFWAANDVAAKAEPFLSYPSFSEPIFFDLIRGIPAPTAEDRINATPRQP